MNDDSLRKYYDEYLRNIEPDFLFENLNKFKDLLEHTSRNSGKAIFSGNGASAAIASHAALDFTKQAKIKSVTYHDSALITAYSNDYGYDKWLEKVLESNLNQYDILVLISVSGESPNIIEAAKYAKSKDIKIITFTGKNIDNTLKSIGDINFWVDSNAYNIVEGIHMIWVTTVVDMIIGKSEYSVS
jgi:D-sedoheptulose 7-phosphate isomerase